jgi:5-formaminoimidazole-4-carboxamide-1-beta-D-ribofuranosyl 5'-monophosphate synthetase
MEQIQFSQLKLGKTYEIEFMNGTKLVVKFTGLKGGRHYFLNNDGQEFSIANNCIQHYCFYKLV